MNGSSPGCGPRSCASGPRQASPPRDRDSSPPRWPRPSLRANAASIYEGNEKSRRTEQSKCSSSVQPARGVPTKNTTKRALPEPLVWHARSRPTLSDEAQHIMDEQVGLSGARHCNRWRGKTPGAVAKFSAHRLLGP